MDDVPKKPRGVAHLSFLACATCLAALALLATGCGSHGSTCGPVEYGGSGAAELIVVSDMPLEGAARPHALQINAAVRAALDERSWRAGRHTVGLQLCDDASEDGGSDARACSRNANEVAGNPQVVGVIGPLESGCAQVMIPVLNQAPDGGVAIVSPTNTYGCLTRAGPGCDLTEPDKYYPSGTRNYVRIAVPDEVQGAALAELAAARGLRSVFVLDDDEAYGVGLATSFRRAARLLGLEIAGSATWDPQAESYTALFERIERTGADAVFLGGLFDQNGRRLLADKVAVLGPNDGAVTLLAPDGFLTQHAIDETDGTAAGMVVSVIGQPLATFGLEARTFAAALAGTGRLNGRKADAYAVYGAVAADVLLTAIARSDGSRSDVIANVLAYTSDESLFGPIAFDKGGDVVGRGAYGVTVYVVRERLELDGVIVPRQPTLDAALGR